MNILLVDDDADAVQALRAALGQANSHDVRTAASREAADTAQAFERLDLLVTNVVMEAIDGFSLSHSLEERFPGLKTIFTTEYDLSDYAEHTEGHDVLAKPVASSDFLASVGRNIRQAAVESASAPAVETPPEETLAKGLVIGGYKIVRPLGEGEMGADYEAARTQSNRPVMLEFLSAKLRSDPESKAKFVNEIIAKARLRHPSILPVYNSEEHGDAVFAVGEFVEGKNLAGIAEAGESIPEPAAVEALRIIAETLSRLNQSRISHSAIGAADIWVGADKRVRISNPITAEGNPPTVQQEMRSLANIIRPVLPGGNPSMPGLAPLLDKMSEGGHAGFSSWEGLLQALGSAFRKAGALPVARPLRPEKPGKFVPDPSTEPGAPFQAPRAPKPPETPEIPGEEKAARPWRKWLFALIWALVGIGALAYLGRLSYTHFFRPQDFDAMVEIPGGDFIYQDNLKLTLPTFWLDKYEVTIGQYAQFLDALEKNPTTRYDSPLQPKTKTTHKPKDWRIYYEPALVGGKAGDVPIDLNCPVFNVDWYDAYAYATWKGRRLPTEMEWEKAGRGTEGFLYPWGNTFDPKKCNSSADYNDNPKAGGNVDGFNRWSPVNAIMKDRSFYGVIGLAGNVAEWTDSWDQAVKIPVVRGGSYHSPDSLLTRRVFLEPGRSSEYVGFRTASSNPPQK